MFIDFRIPKPFVCVSALPAALRRPQKKHVLDFSNTYIVNLVDFSKFCIGFSRFPGPQALCVCVGAACGASPTSEKTRSGFLKHVSC